MQVCRSAGCLGYFPRRWTTNGSASRTAAAAPVRRRAHAHVLELALRATLNALASSRRALDKNTSGALAVKLHGTSFG
jgi:hypothetical protein